MKKTIWMLIVSAVLTSACIHLSLVNPEAAVPPHASLDQVKLAVHEALTHYKWVIEDEKPGSTTAHLQQKELYARIQVDYDQHRAQVRYLDSKNMSYSKSGSKETIHSRYMVWARNIAERTHNNLNPASGTSPASGSPPRKDQ